MKTFTAKHPVATYFVLTFAISWGGFILAIGPRGFASTDWQTEPRFVWAIAALLAGPSSLTACTIFIFRPIATGLRFLAFVWILTAALWAMVAVVAMFNRGELTRSPNPSRVARRAA